MELAQLVEIPPHRLQEPTYLTHQVNTKEAADLAT